MTVVESLIRNEIDGEKHYVYAYRLVKSNILLSSGSDTMEVQSYGIEVERQDLVEGKTVSIERDTVKSISPHRHKVHSLLKVLYDNSVSPIHLIDVIGDNIDEYILEFDKYFEDISVN